MMLQAWALTPDGLGSNLASTTYCSRTTLDKLFLQYEPQKWSC